VKRGLAPSVVGCETESLCLRSSTVTWFSGQKPRAGGVINYQPAEDWTRLFHSYQFDNLLYF
jgi:hypothetical protein